MEIRACARHEASSVARRSLSSLSYENTSVPWTASAHRAIHRPHPLQLQSQLEHLSRARRVSLVAYACETIACSCAVVSCLFTVTVFLIVLARCANLNKEQRMISEDYGTGCIHA